MTTSTQLFIDRASKYPYPIATTLKRHSEQQFTDSFKEWESLSTGVLPPVLTYLSHLLLSDLVSTGRQPAHLYHRIQSILSRPMMGHYVGFLRETARYYRQEQINSSVPELVSFLLASDVDCTHAGDGKALLGELLDYRNLLAHGRIDNPKVMEDILTRVRALTDMLIQKINFLTRYPLQLENGSSMMGWSLPKMAETLQPLVLVTTGNLQIRPLLLKLKGDDLLLIDDFDIRNKKLGYRGSTSYKQLRKKEIEKGEGKSLFHELKELLRKVRSEEALLDLADCESFRERSSVLTQRTLDLYDEMGKFKPKFYVPRNDWEGKDSVFTKFLESEKSLLAISGVQGTGKSALTAHLANNSIEEGHTVLFINAQRFSFAQVEWSENPYPNYFSEILHYKCPFDKTAIARIIKTREDKDKKVILFIDAINEVDGLSKKWNRFIAMELLLDWIGKVAQPGLKIVLSFRVDVYEDFDYLQDDDEFMPGNLYDISYPGNHPRKKWVWELEPFNEEQAEALFEKFQGKNEYGMSPAMTWNEIKEGLEGKLKEITDNPLILQIFLRAHNGEKQVLEKDRNSIFLHYGEKLTGVREEKKKSWRKKLLNFFRNGNITDKEQLLFDLIEKMTEESGAALLVERLDAKTKRDKRLLKKIVGTENNSYRDLKDGGLLAEEKIEFTINNNLSYSTRISFTGELMISALRGILYKVKMKHFVWFNIFFALFIFIGFPLFLGCLSFMIGTALENKSMVEGTAMIVLKGLFIYWTTNMFLFLGLLLVPFEIATYYSMEKQYKVGELGVQQSSFISAFEKSYRVIYVLIIWIVLGFIFFFAAYIIDSELNSVLSFSPILGLITGLVLVVVVPRIYLKNYIGFANDFPKKIVLKSLRFRYLELKNKKYIITKLKAVLIRISGLILLLITYPIFFKFYERQNLNLTAKAYSFDGYFHVELIKIIETFKLAVRYYFVERFGVFVILIPLFLFALLFYAEVFSYKKILSLLLNKIVKIKVKNYKNYFHYYFGIFFILGIIVAFGYQHFKSQQTDLGIIEKLNVGSSDYILNDDGKVKFLDLSNHRITQDNIHLLELLPSLDSLTLPTHNFNYLITPKLFEKLNYLRCPAKSLIGNSENTNVLNTGDIQIFDFDEIADEGFQLRGVISIKLMGESAKFHRIATVFPNIKFCEASEEILYHDNLIFPDLGPNFGLKITNSDTLNLNWLNEEAANYILSVDKPISKNAQNVNYLERLSINIENQDPSVFNKATSLKWLFIKMDYPQTTEFYVKMLKIAKESLPQLEVLDIMKEGEFNTRISGRGKDEILSMLDRLKENPELVGK